MSNVIRSLAVFATLSLVAPHASAIDLVFQASTCERIFQQTPAPQGSAPRKAPGAVSTRARYLDAFSKPTLIVSTKPVTALDLAKRVYDLSLRMPQRDPCKVWADDAARTWRRECAKAGLPVTSTPAEVEAKLKALAGSN